MARRGGEFISARILAQRLRRCRVERALWRASRRMAPRLCFPAIFRDASALRMLLRTRAAFLHSLVEWAERARRANARRAGVPTETARHHGAASAGRWARRK